MKTYKPEMPLDTPYAKAKAEWDMRLGNAVIQAKNWRMAFFATLAFVAFPSIAGNIIQATQSKLIPYIVEVNEDGSVNSKGRITKSWNEYSPNKGVAMSMLRTFIEKSRTIPSDRNVLKKNWAEIYSLVSLKAAQSLQQEWDTIFTRMKDGMHETVYVDIKSIIPLSENSWQVEWAENTFSRQGGKVSSMRWRATFQLRSHAPETEAEFEKNPIGLYITEFYWSPIKE